MRSNVRLNDLLCVNLTNGVFMIVSEFIEWLKLQDQGATVEVLHGTRSVNWEGDSYRKVAFDPAIHGDYTDMRGNPFAKGKPYENSRTLFIGEAE